MIRACTAEEAKPLLARAMRHDTSGGVASLDDILAGCACYLAEVDGRPILAWAIKREGAVGWIMAASGRDPGRDLFGDFLPVIEAQLRECRQTALVTRRPALMKKLKAAGYEFAGVIMRKNRGAPCSA